MGEKNLFFNSQILLLYLPISELYVSKYIWRHLLESPREYCYYINRELKPKNFSEIAEKTLFCDLRILRIVVRALFLMY